MERGPGDVRHILAAQRKLDRRAVGRVVSGLANMPQDGTGNALFDPLGGNLCRTRADVSTSSSAADGRS
jgi:hypothetical protein